MTVSELPILTGRAFERQFDLLKLELTLIDSAIRSLDEITKSIKQWAIVAWTGGIGLALGTPSLKPSVWTTVFLPLTFWIVEGFFRRVQRSFVVRIQDIAAFLNSPAFVKAAQQDVAVDFPLMKMRNKAGRKTSWLAVMVFRTVAALYVLMIGGSVLIWVLVSAGKM